MRLICFILSLLFFSPASVNAQTKIIAQVNDDIISDRDLVQRLEFIRLTGQADTTKPDIRDRLLKQLIDEKLKLQEAVKADLSVSDAELKRAVEVTLRQNGLEYQDVLKMLRENDLPLSVIEDQIKSDLLFIRAVKKTAGKRAEVTDREITEKLNEIKSKSSQTNYLLSQIRLSPEKGETSDDVYGRAMQIIMRLQNNESLEDVGRSLGLTPSELTGWVAEDTLSADAREEIKLMQAGQVSSPVKADDGYTVFVLHAERAPSDVDEKQEVVRLMQLFIPDTFTAKQRQSVLRDLNMTKGSCAQFQSVAEELRTTPRVDLGQMPLSELPSPLRSIINRTALLEPSAPLRIEGGELVLMACARETVSALPDRDEIKMRLESVKLEQIAQRRLTELRRTAVTEIRK